MYLFIYQLGVSSKCNFSVIHEGIKADFFPLTHTNFYRINLH
jgi:hypothetical protein